MRGPRYFSAGQQQLAQSGIKRLLSGRALFAGDALRCGRKEWVESWRYANGSFRSKAATKRFRVSPDAAFNFVWAVSMAVLLNLYGVPANDDLPDDLIGRAEKAMATSRRLCISSERERSLATALAWTNARHASDVRAALESMMNTARSLIGRTVTREPTDSHRSSTRQPLVTLVVDNLAMKREAPSAARLLNLADKLHIKAAELDALAATQETENIAAPMKVAADQSRELAVLLRRGIPALRDSSE